jgi:hypothetical protein
MKRGGGSHLEAFLMRKKLRCCYIKVDFATAASQNRLNTHKLSIQKMAKNIRIVNTLIFYQRAVVNKDH